MRITGPAAGIIGYMIPAVVVGCVLIIVGAVGYWLLTTDVDRSTTDATRTAELIRMQATAKTYFARLAYYDGVCDVVGLSDRHGCNDGADGYAIDVPLSTGGYYCADATGFLGKTVQPIGSARSCTR